MRKGNSGKGQVPLRRVRVEDVARIAGVSPITVSRTLSNPEKVRPETRERVEAAVAQTGYTVDTMASSLRSGRSAIVSMFVSGLENTEINRAIQGVTDVLDGSGYHLLMGRINPADAAHADGVAAVSPLRPAGIIMAGMVSSNAEREGLVAIGSPVVEMGDETDLPFDMLSGCSNTEAGRLVGEHFGEQGFGCVAFVGTAGGRSALRLQGFRAGLAPFGLHVEHALTVTGASTPSEGREAFDAVLRELPACDAIFVGDPLLAIGAALRAELTGLAADIAIAGFGEMAMAEVLGTPMTTVRIPTYDIGVNAARLLLRRLRGEKLNAMMILCPARLDARPSTLRRKAAAE